MASANLIKYIERVCLRRNSLPLLGGWSTVVHKRVSIHIRAHTHSSLCLGPISHLQDPVGRGTPGTCAPTEDLALGRRCCACRGRGLGHSGDLCTFSPPLAIVLSTSDLPAPRQPLPPRSWVSWTAMRPSLPLLLNMKCPRHQGCDGGCQCGASPTAWGEDSFSPTPAGHQPSDPSLQGTPHFVFAVIAYQG